jgi:Leucine-rich repeat (LRR) protein
MKPHAPPTLKPRPAPSRPPSPDLREGPPGTVYSGPCDLDDDKRAQRITQKIQKHVLDNGNDETRGRELKHRKSNPSPSATDLALEWLINNDAMRLCPSDHNLIQRFVVATFYFSTGGDDWNECGRNDSGKKRNDNGASKCEDGGKWLSSIPECLWRGIGCDKGGSLVQISIENNNLRGEIPPVLSQLMKLKVLALEKGHLTGCIPEAIGELIHLKRLDLDYNSLGGQECAFPDLSKLVNLEQLDLNDNSELSGDLTSIRRSTKLLFVSLHNTKFSGIIPKSLGINASKLQVLTIQNTEIQGDMPESICNLRIDKGGRLHHLVADCTMECSCCTECNGKKPSF